jgi:hypothetical protein
MTIFGGACFDDEMGREYHRGLPEVIDHVFLGEAEQSFREFLRRIRNRRADHGHRGRHLVGWDRHPARTRSFSRRHGGCPGAPL